MYFVVLGVILLLLKVLDVAGVGAWSWWSVLWPFAGAVAWWAYADQSGFTKRREMNKMDERRNERRRKQMLALGRNPREGERAAKVQQAAKARSSRFEQEQAKRRDKNRETIARSSRFDSSQHSSQFDQR